MALFTSRHRVYWSDTDAAGIAHFTSFFRYCEKTEEDLLYSVAGKRDFRSVGVLLPRVKASCDYLYPLYPGDVARVDIEDIVVGDKSVTYKFTVYNETRRQRSAECEIVAVAVDPKTMRSTSLPGELRQLLISIGAKEKPLQGSSLK
ncbi:MAG: acyl-CoA thioesterase [Desulfurococcales archaeon]|nr:acyl-CoA thioesterase [Desulfurococcales archaeon]